jgi:hypothetical protein
VLRYVPDQGAGEGLNIGVIVYSEQARYFGHRIDQHYERLSRAFATAPRDQFYLLGTIFNQDLFADDLPNVRKFSLPLSSYWSAAEALLTRLRSDIAEGLQGDGIPAQQVFADLRAKYTN